MSTKFSFVKNHIRKHPFAFTSIILVGFLNSSITFLLPVSIGEFFQFNFHTGSSKGKLFERLGLHIGNLEQFFLLFFILLLLKMLFSYLEFLGEYRHGELFVKDLRERVFAAQINWESERFLQTTYGKFLLRYSNDMKAVQNCFTKGVIGGIMNVLFLITGLALLWTINSRLTIFISFLLFFVMILIWFIAALQKPFIRSSRSNRSSLLAFVARSFESFQNIKMKGTEANAIRKFNQRSENLFLSNMRSNRMEGLLLTTSQFLIFMMIGMLLWQMTMPYASISAPEGLMMVLVLLMMQGTLRKLFKVPGYINKGNISLQKIRKLLQQQNRNDAIPLFQNRKQNI